MSEFETDRLLWAISALGLLMAVASYCAYFLLARRAKQGAWAVRVEFSGLVHEIENIHTGSERTDSTKDVSA